MPLDLHHQRYQRTADGHLCGGYLNDSRYVTVFFPEPPVDLMISEHSPRSLQL